MKKGSFSCTVLDCSLCDRFSLLCRPRYGEGVQTSLWYDVEFGTIVVLSQRYAVRRWQSTSTVNLDLGAAQGATASAEWAWEGKRCTSRVIVYLVE